MRLCEQRGWHSFNGAGVNVASNAKPPAKHIGEVEWRYLERDVQSAQRDRTVPILVTPLTTCSVWNLCRR